MSCASSLDVPTSIASHSLSQPCLYTSLYMRKLTALLFSLMLLALSISCSKKSNPPAMEILHTNDTLTRIEINSPQRYLLLPIEESQPEVQVRLVGDRPEDTWLDIRLAVDSIAHLCCC